MNKDQPNGKVTRAEMEIVLDQTLEILPVMIQKATAEAKLLRAKYNALVNEGFTEYEALAIIKARPLME